MQEAIRLAVENVKNGGGPFAALVVKNGEVIASGVNLVTPANDPTAHAEIVAIRNACRRLNCFQLTGCEIYTTCEPCPMCLGATFWARPARVYYASTREDAARAGFDDSFIYDQLELPESGRAIPCIRVTAAETEAPFLAWGERQDKVRY